MIIIDKKLDKNILKILINEEFDRICEAMKEGFSFEDLLNIGSYNGRVRYCKEMLGNPIGNGSSRIVFQIDDERVLKVAKNQKGIVQNEFESEYGKENYDIFPHIYNVDRDNFIFIECEYVLPCKKQDFQHILGISFEEFQDYIRFVYNCYVHPSRKMRCGMTQERFEELSEVSNLYAIQCYLSDYGLETIGDILRLANLGLVRRDGYDWIVILDDGLSEQVYNDYYRRR